MDKKTIPKKVVKDILIVAFGVLIMWTGVQAIFGTSNPFYVVASGSMVPALEKNDVLIVQGNKPFEEIQRGDVIVFDRPSDHNKVIVHRVVSVIDDDPKTLRTQGDANSASIPGTDFPITEEEYLGEVVYAIPQIGYVTEFLKPPLNYILMSIIIGVVVITQITNKKTKN